MNAKKEKAVAETAKELELNILNAQKELLALRMKAAVSGHEKPHKLSELRKNISRWKFQATKAAK